MLKELGYLRLNGSPNRPPSVSSGRRGSKLLHFFAVPWLRDSWCARGLKIEKGAESKKLRV